MKSNIAIVPACSATAVSRGDPHFTTVDGVKYDMHVLGAFEFCRSSNVLIETCQIPSSSRASVSVNKAVAVRLNDASTVLLMYNDQDGEYELYVDGVEESVESGSSLWLPASGATINVTLWTSVRASVKITMPLLDEVDDADVIVLDGFSGRFANVKYTPSTGNYLQTEGLCGLWDCLSSNDRASSTGTLYSSGDNVNTWASTWRRAQASLSLFGNLPVDCLFTTDPIILPEVDPPTSDEQTQAESCCGSLMFTNNTLYSECVIDILAQGGSCTGPYVQHYTELVNKQAPNCSDASCGGHGTCVAGECICVGGYSGASCSVPPGKIICYNLLFDLI